MFGKAKTIFNLKERNEGRKYTSQSYWKEDSPPVGFSLIIQSLGSPLLLGHEAGKGTAFRTGAAFGKKPIQVQIKNLYEDQTDI